MASWLEGLATGTSANARAEGAAIAEGGGVSLGEASRIRIVARVRDGPEGEGEGEDWEVAIETRAFGLETSCGCVLHGLGLVVCRHIWAALVEAARRERSPTLDIRAGPEARPGTIPVSCARRRRMR